MTKFIAELGSNHNGSLDRCYKLITTAKDIGCWAVKFQLFDENLYAPQYIKQRERLRKWQLPLDYIPKIAEYCKEKDIKFGCSVFYFEAVEILKPYVDFFKIGSYEMLYIDLIKTVIQAGKPWMISAGMSLNYPGTIIAIQLMGANMMNSPCTIFHCNSNYPALPEGCELKDIQELSSLFEFSKTPIGWSDHTRHPGVIYAAIAQGAEVVEFHMDLEDEQGWEYEHGHVWLPSEIKEVIGNVRIGEAASQPNEQKLEHLRQQRTDVDGMRPMREVRK